MLEYGDEQTAALRVLPSLSEDGREGRAVLVLRKHEETETELPTGARTPLLSFVLRCAGA